MIPLVLPDTLRFKGVVGTGGIGSGKFFALNDNHTLGREESRSGHFLDVNDYCKQHIILHYISVLLGSRCRVVPVGLVGADDTGANLIEEMKSVGMVMDHVEQRKGLSTLFSFCFHYPDRTGGNLTTDNSASGHVDEAYIDKAEIQIRSLGREGLIIAVPEVPMKARQRLLKLGREHHSFCTASFTSEEIVAAGDAGMLNNIDLIAINADEANAFVGQQSTPDNYAALAESAIHKLRDYNDSIMVSVTAGAAGSWCWDGSAVHYCPAFPVAVVSTAGAGDAFFAGLITGLAAGLTLHEAQSLSSLVAACSVTSPDTIHRGLDRSTLAIFLSDNKFVISDKISALLNQA